MRRRDIRERARSAPRGLGGGRVAARIPAVVALALLPAAGQVPAAAAAGTHADAGTPASASAQVPRAAAESDSGSAADSGPGSGSGYRYWSFWEQKEETGGRPADEPGEWSYATQGPSTLRPRDGGVIGFRFAVSEDSEDAARPRHSPEFSTVCRPTVTKPVPGRKRIALVIDFGLPRDAPRGEDPPEPRTECARVPEDATAADALAAVAEPLRYDSAAVLCAIHGYPRRGCAEQVARGKGDGREEREEEGGEDDANDAAGTEGQDGGGGDQGGFPGGSLGSVTGVAAALAAVAALAFAAVRRSRGRR